MLELAQIFRDAGPAYERAHAGQMPPSQRRAMHDIVACRTPALGGSLYRCDDCGALDYAYHSCRNRHCPKCQEDRAQQWLERQRARLLPCDHYLLTFTLPYQLRAVARTHREIVYSSLLREAAAAVQTLAADPTWVGGTLGILAVLHTWSRTLEYHPHAHLLVTAGGLSPDGAAWVTPAQPRFLMPGYALSQIFRAKMRDALARAGLDRAVDPTVWERAWTVHIQQIGNGAHATRYLARYVYHVALTNHRLERFEHGRVTFRYTHARTRETRRVTLPVDTFIARFLQHVLPRGFTKIRYYGLLSPTGRTDLERARTLLALHASQHVRPAAAAGETTSPGSIVHDSGHTIVESSGVHLDT
ncbi:MAG: IS91 family transposase, partial [Gemmatimonadaceae bacterium]|nr:IS91 family transposase [Gemmatimonadaceae bacterium]